jgi:N utilization substance protein B
LASKKHLATKEEINPSYKFIHNKVLHLLATSEALENALDDRKIKNWKNVQVEDDKRNFKSKNYR